jgi:adenylate cyclase
MATAGEGRTLSGERKENFVVRGWRNVREAGPRRLAFTGLLVLAALAIARFGWAIPGVSDAERALYDSRVFVEADRNDVPQDDRVVMVVFNDQTLIKARKRSPLDRGIIAEALRTLDTMGAKAIGIDILFDQPQDEDAELITTLREMRTPVAVAYADSQINEGNVTYDQEQFLKGFLAQLEGSGCGRKSCRASPICWGEPCSRLREKARRRCPAMKVRCAISCPGMKAARSIPICQSTHSLILN